MLLVILFMFQIACGMEPTSSCSVTIYNSASAAAARSASPEEDVCEVALSTFMKRTDSDLAKYLRPHLVSVIKEANDSPDSDDSEDPSPHRTIKTWVTHPESVKSTPNPELNEVILSAMRKAFEEKEALLEKKSKKIEGMFSKRDTAIITTIATILVTITTSLASIFATKDHC